MRGKKDTDINLIEAVQKFPQLFDKKNSEYKNQIKKRHIWTAIARSAGFDGIVLLFFKHFLLL